MMESFRHDQNETVHNQRLPSGYIYECSKSQTEETEKLREGGPNNLRSINNDVGPRNSHFNKRSKDFSDCVLRSDKPGNQDAKSLNEGDSDTKGDRLNDPKDNCKPAGKIRSSQHNLGEETNDESEILQEMMLEDLKLEVWHLWDPVLERFIPCGPEINTDDIRRDSLGSRQNQDEVTTTFRQIRHDSILEIDDGLNFSDLLDPGYHRNLVHVAAPNYLCGPEVVDECLVCFEKTKLRKRLCCDFAVCDECIGKYLKFEVESGFAKIKCMSGTCDSFIHRDEILERLPPEIKDKFYRFLIDANKDPDIKTCPRCINIYNRIENGVVQNYGKYGVKVECPDCKLDWCFECQAPWHANIKCKDFRKGDKLLKSWAKEHHCGQPNAQRCPKCKIFIQRKSGCDHMSCSNCNTDFCYQCGDRYIDLSFFGSHNSRLSPLGCKYNYKPDEPVKRKLVRGSLLGAQLVIGVFLVGLGLAAGAILIGASPVILPVFGGIKCRRYLKECRAQEEWIPT